MNGGGERRTIWYFTGPGDGLLRSCDEAVYAQVFKEMLRKGSG